MKTETIDNSSTQNSHDLPADIAVNRDDLIALRNSAHGLTLILDQKSGSALTGQHQSRFRGRGMDYLESRHYQAGDDVRNFDWRVTARTSQPHIKLYVEEREQPVFVLVDLSASMSLASQGAFKSVIAARITTILGWITIAQSDRIGGLVYRSPNEYLELKPQGGRQGILRLIDFLAQLGEPHTDFDNEHAGLPDSILQRISHMATHGAQVIIISDFFYPSPRSHEYLEKLKYHNNVLAIQVVDPLELAAPPAGEYGVSDGLISWRMNLEGHRQQQSLKAVLNTRQQQIKKAFYNLDIPLLQVLTNDDISAVLHHFLKRKRSGYQGNLLTQGEAVA